LVRNLKTTVTIIGAGATGLALAIELQNAGVDFIVVDKGDPGMGSTCHSAGVLHSGARYALTDPELAKTCRQSQEFFLSVAPFTVSNKSDAYYLITDRQSEVYATDLVDACRRLEVPIRYVSRTEIRESEPHISIDAMGALAVPDVTVDPFLLVASYVEEITNRGAAITPRAEILSATWNHDCWRLELFDTMMNRTQTVFTKMVIVAAGPWTARVLNHFGISLNLRYINGCMFVLNDKVVDRIVTLCQPPTSCDSLIPCYSNTLLGSTWSQQDMADPTLPVSGDRGQATSALSRLLDVSYDQVVSHAYSGVRVILATKLRSAANISRTAKRASYLLDHSEQNGVNNLISIFGGKLTFHNTMAQQAATLVCQKLGASYTNNNRISPMKIPTNFPRKNLASSP